MSYVDSIFVLMCLRFTFEVITFKIDDLSFKYLTVYVGLNYILIRGYSIGTKNISIKKYQLTV